jgi:hypothetical protein
MTIRVYVSGPMSNMPEFNFPAFHAAAAELRARGYEVVNPAELDEGDDAIVGSMPWEDYLRRDIRALMDCNAIALLPGWQASRGASLEEHIARTLKFEVIELRPASPVALCEAAAAERE